MSDGEGVDSRTGYGRARATFLRELTLVGAGTMHSEENLVSSDRGVALVRRQLMQQLDAPPAATRSASASTPTRRRSPSRPATS